MQCVMFEEMDARRVGFTLLLAAWLGVQSLVAALSPGWGFVLPHEHVTRGALSQGAWQEHLRAHRIGAPLFYKTRCEVSNATESVLASIPNNLGALATFGAPFANVHDARVEIPAFNVVCVSLTHTEIAATEMFYSPLHPPPNF